MPGYLKVNGYSESTISLVILRLILKSLLTTNGKTGRGTNHLSFLYIFFITAGTSEQWNIRWHFIFSTSIDQPVQAIRS